MIRVHPRLSRVFLSTALAAALCGPALAAPMYLKLGGVQGESRDDSRKGQIEILSWSWGETIAVTHSGSGGMGAGKVSMGPEPATQPKDNVEQESKVEESESARSESGEKGGTEDINTGVGELQEAAPSESAKTAQPGTETTGGVQVAAGDVDGDGLTEAPSGQDAPPTTTARPLPAATESGPKLILARPLDRGSVRVKLRFPWTACRVGATYPALELGGGARVYRLKDATVTSCGASASSGDRPMEEIAFNYSRVEF